MTPSDQGVGKDVLTWKVKGGVGVVVLKSQQAWTSLGIGPLMWTDGHTHYWKQYLTPTLVSVFIKIDIFPFFILKNKLMEPAVLRTYRNHCKDFLSKSPFFLLDLNTEVTCWNGSGDFLGFWSTPNLNWNLFAVLSSALFMVWKKDE